MGKPNSLIKQTLATLLLITVLEQSAFAQSEKLNIIVFGAHPDDADFKAGGTAINLVREGHNVLFVSATNGDAGHYQSGGKELAKRRYNEAREAGKRLGVKYIILENHDGQLIPTLENRNQIIRLIREWKADMVIGHRPNDYHPDHRNLSTLLQDAAYMVIVPNVVSDIPPLKRNPVFLYMEDAFQKPLSFEPDICVDITDVYSQKIYAMSAHESQYFEWLPWTTGTLASIPSDEKERLLWLAEIRKPKISAMERESLTKWYGQEKGNRIKLAESFEICEYGRQFSEDEIRQIFRMPRK